MRLTRSSWATRLEAAIIAVVLIGSVALAAL